MAWQAGFPSQAFLRRVVGSLEDFGDYGGELREHVERSLDQVTAD